MRNAPSQTTIRRALARRGNLVLAPFESSMAPLVATWPRDGQELFWLAPKTVAPLTPAKVVAWAGPECRPLLFCQDDLIEPLGYLELNPMPADFGHYWLGHCIVHSSFRGRGLGRHMIGLGLDLAFRTQRAYRVSLVVFPDNAGAIRCYRNAGFVDAGDQYKYFPSTGRQHRMIQMTIDRGRYLALPVPHKPQLSE